MIRSIEERGFTVYSLSVLHEATQLANRDDADRIEYAEWLGSDWSDDANQTAEILAGKKSDWLVIDHYSLDKRWELEIKKYVPHLLVIDDLADRQHGCDLLLDQNLGRKREDYSGLIPRN